ncbi:MAG: oxygen-independent coproporphyrinogen III oxidase [Burkholderiales bacterium]|nr:oxygen-independent coproporphyrinogen III oxidase [Burkholderiales bacterium]
MFSAEVLKRFDLNGPRYTSYPTADRFTPSFRAEAYGAALSGMASRPASLYVHVPFCRSLCYYCACNKIVSKSATVADEYLAVLAAEMALVSGAASKSKPRHPVVQLAFGGGTPNFLSVTQLSRVMRDLGEHFDLLPGREQGIELDPRFLDDAYVSALPGMGFNRVSYGVQDFDERVQTLIHRFQSFDQTAQAVKAARDVGINSISFDLVYGLPIQSRETFAATLERVLSLEPDRLALFNYAHIPERFKAQRRIPTETLPSIEQRTDLFLYATERLVDAGYLTIGLDHFAKPGDPLADAYQDGTLRRNFQGYSTHQSTDLIGLGVSAISNLNGVFAQNSPQIDVYRERITQGQFATVRGVTLSRDDEIRSAVIEAIMCNGGVDWAVIGERFNIDPAEYFDAAREPLERFAEVGIVTLNERRLQVTAQGKLLLRAVAMVFDAYKNLKREQVITFSRIA